MLKDYNLTETSKPVRLHFSFIIYLIVNENKTLDFDLDRNNILPILSVLILRIDKFCEVAGGYFCIN